VNLSELIVRLDTKAEVSPAIISTITCK